MSSSATSEVDLANMALTMLGQQPISDLTDDNNRANMADKRLADVRDSVLRSHAWNCAMKRAALSKHATAPAWGYDNKYTLPADFIRLVATEDEIVDYRIEAGNQGEDNDTVILTDNDELNILYVYKITDVSKMDSTLKQAIATRLAADIAVAITGDAAQENAMMQKYELLLAQARWEDSAEHHKMETIHGGNWLDARAGGGFFRDFPNLDSSGQPI